LAHIGSLAARQARSKAITPRELAQICGDFSESAPERGLGLGVKSGGERALPGVDMTAALAAPSIHLYLAAQCMRAARLEIASSRRRAMAIHSSICLTRRVDESIEDGP
jgi:hypothetical protein